MNIFIFQSTVDQVESYGMTLCSLDRIFKIQQNVTLSDLDKSYLLQNPIRPKPSACSALQFRRKFCPDSKQTKMSKYLKLTQIRRQSSLFFKVSREKSCIYVSFNINT